MRIVSVDGECDVTCINCMSIDNEGDAWSVQTDSAKATLNLYGCKSILTDNSARIGFVYRKLRIRLDILMLMDAAIITPLKNNLKLQEMEN